MADLVDAAHFDAMLGLLRADAGLTVYPDAEGFTPDGATPPYVRTYFWIERPPAEPGNSLSGTSRTWTTYLMAHCAGVNERAAAGVLMRVDRALLDQRPTVAGRDCGLIRQAQCAPPLKDDSTGVTIFDAIATYRFTSSA